MCDIFVYILDHIILKTNVRFVNCLRIFFHFPDYHKEHTAGLTGQQRMLTPPWHLILPLLFVKFSVCYAPVLNCPFGLLILNTEHHVITEYHFKLQLKFLFFYLKMYQLQKPQHFMKLPNKTKKNKQRFLLVTIL